MAARGLVVTALLLPLLMQECYGVILFSSLKKLSKSPLLLHKAKVPQNYYFLIVYNQDYAAVLKAGEDKVTITWGVNQSLSAGTDSAFKTIKVFLCYAPISQKDRAWRKTEDHLNKDKTCQFKIVEKPYNKILQTLDWIIERDVPTANYFARAYAFNAGHHEVAYGQSTNDQKTTNLFVIQAISGRHMSLDIASVCFSAFAVVSLFGFFAAEKRKAKRSQQK